MTALRPIGVMRAIAAYFAVRRALRSELEGPALDALLDRVSSQRASGRPLALGALAIAVRVAERFVPVLSSAPNTCLFRAIARFAVLAEYGHSPHFILGVRPGLEGAGHAWVEVNGAPFLEREPPPFVRTFSREAVNRVAK